MCVKFNKCLVKIYSGLNSTKDALQVYTGQQDLSGPKVKY